MGYGSDEGEDEIEALRPSQKDRKVEDVGRSEDKSRNDVEATDIAKTGDVNQTEHIITKYKNKEDNEVLKDELTTSSQRGFINITNHHLYLA